MNYDIDLCSSRKCEKRETCRRSLLFLHFREHEDGEAHILPYCVEQGLYIRATNHELLTLGRKERGDYRGE